MLCKTIHFPQQRERERVKLRIAMEKKTALAFLLVLFVVAADLEVALADASDCIDACYTGCVNSNTRLMQRCERKCQIRCGPDALKVHIERN